MAKPTYEQCGGKNRYSKAEATRAKKFVGLRRHKDMRIYLCEKCHGYHLTKKHRTL